jgi:hypothetical protein
MSLEANKALVRRHIEEAFNNKHLDVINERVAPDFVDHTNPPDWPEGREGHRQFVALFHNSFVFATLAGLIKPSDAEESTTKRKSSESDR